MTAENKNFKTLLVISDLHLSAVNPASRIDNYTEALFAKLDQVLELIVSLKADALIIAGDIFHLKSWVKNPYWLTNRFMAWLKKVHETDTKIILSVGNHDVPFENMNLIEKQPIGSILSLGFVKQEVYFEDIKLRIVAKNFNPKFTAEDLKVQKQGEDRLVLVVHQCLMAKGQFYDEPTVNFFEVESEADVIITGHIHSPRMAEKHNGIWFINPGALSRGAISKDDINRTPGVMALRVGDKIEHCRVKLITAPANEIFDLEKKDRKEKRETEIEEFVDNLGVSTSKVDNMDPKEIMKDLDVDERIRAMACTYLDGDKLQIEEL